MRPNALASSSHPLPGGVTSATDFQHAFRAPKSLHCGLLLQKPPSSDEILQDVVNTVRPDKNRHGDNIPAKAGLRVAIPVAVGPKPDRVTNSAPSRQRRSCKLRVSVN